MVVTSGKEWRKPREEGIEITFPSGNTARIRPVGSEWFLAQGNIPDLLTPIIAAEAEGRDWMTDEKAVSSLAELGKSLDFLNSMIKAFFVSPKVVENPQSDDEISPADVEYQDKLALMNFIGAPAVALRTFRENQIRDAARVSTVKTGSRAAQQDHENPAESEADTGDERLLDTATV
jgi:hypothetical protein